MVLTALIELFSFCSAVLLAYLALSANKLIALIEDRYKCIHSFSQHQMQMDYLIQQKPALKTTDNEFNLTILPGFVRPLVKIVADILPRPLLI